MPAICGLSVRTRTHLREAPVAVGKFSDRPRPTIIQGFTKGWATGFDHFSLLSVPRSPLQPGFANQICTPEALFFGKTCTQIDVTSTASEVLSSTYQGNNGPMMQHRVFEIFKTK